MDSVTERVERGGTLLDEARPGWPWLVDPDILNLGDGCLCVGGQLCGKKTGTEGDYVIFVREIGLDAAGEFAHGFDGDGGDGGYAALTAAWRDLIIRRRESAAVPA